MLRKNFLRISALPVQRTETKCLGFRLRCFAICFIGVELSCRESISKNSCTARPAHRSDTPGFSIIEQGLWPIAWLATSAGVVGKAGSPLPKSGFVARVNHEGRWALKGRMILPSAWKGRTKAKKRSEEVGESTWKRNTPQAGPVCHLTSPWSGRLRAAHFSAAHQRVRRLRNSGYEVPPRCRSSGTASR